MRRCGPDVLDALDALVGAGRVEACKTQGKNPDGSWKRGRCKLHPENVTPGKPKIGRNLINLPRRARKAATTGTAKPSKVTSQRVPGRPNITQEMKANWDTIGPAPFTRLGIDPWATEIMKMQPGFDTPSQVVSKEQMDDAIENGGWTQMWRGVRDYGVPAAEIAETNRTGPWEMNSGAYGAGVYFSPRRTTAEGFRYDDEHAFTKAAEENFDGWSEEPPYEWEGKTPPGAAKGGLIRAALAPDARVLELDKAARDDMFALFLEEMGKPWQTAVQNIGIYALLNGYDAVHIPTAPGRTDGGSYPFYVQAVAEAPQYLILNRSAIITEEPSDRYDA